MSKDEFDSAVRVIESCSGFTESDTPAGEAWEVVLARIADLESIVSRLPKTADGVPWHEAPAEVYVDVGGGEIETARRSHHIAMLDGANGEEAIVPHDECYSTRAAAEASRTQEQKTKS